MFFFNQNLAEDYKSETQKIRVMSESWLQEYGYCVRCGKKLKHFKTAAREKLISLTKQRFVIVTVLLLILIILSYMKIYREQK